MWCHDREDTAIVAAILAIAGALDLQVTAEGVETHAQLAHLRALGCASIQGYLYSRPVRPEAIERLLAGSQTLAPDGANDP